MTDSEKLDQALHGLWNDMMRDPSVTASGIIMELGRRAYHLGHGHSEIRWAHREAAKACGAYDDKI